MYLLVDSDHIKRKKIDKSLVIVEKNITFAPRLSYGVMVALQFLVLSVVVRIRLGQQKALVLPISYVLSIP